MSSTPVPNLPERPLWGRFSADPRVHVAFRASDADRDVAADVVNQAFQEGRLDTVEHGDRLAAVLQAKTLGEMVPLLSDITVSGRPPMPVEASTPVAKTRRVAVRSWVAGAVLFNVIWLATWVLSASGPYYYWPLWPMIGTAIPLILAFVHPDHQRDRDERHRRGDDRDHRELGH